MSSLTSALRKLSQNPIPPMMTSLKAVEVAHGGWKGRQTEPMVGFCWVGKPEEIKVAHRQVLDPMPTPSGAATRVRVGGHGETTVSVQANTVSRVLDVIEIRKSIDLI